MLMQKSQNSVTNVFKPEQKLFACSWHGVACQQKTYKVHRQSCAGWMPKQHAPPTMGS